MERKTSFYILLIMTKMYRRNSVIMWVLVFLSCFSFQIGATNPPAGAPVTLVKNEKDVVMDNGIITATISVPAGNVVSIKYNGIENVLEKTYRDHDRGYWDVACNLPGSETVDIIDRLTCTEFKVIAEEENMVEISFTKTWAPGAKEGAPVNADKRYILSRGVSGLYTYAILDRPQGWPDANLDLVRTVYKLDQTKFRWMSVSDTRQRIMPIMKDRDTGQPLEYPEAVLLTNPADPSMKGEVDDKYQYSCENKDNKVHGWVSEEAGVGLWMINPSDESRIGGPMKQELSSHAGCIMLCVFTSKHYAGGDVALMFRNGEPWKKVYGPVLVYLNSAAPGSKPAELWENAKQQWTTESTSWPYAFPKSLDYCKADQRGKVEGQLSTHDTFLNKEPVPADGAYVGLAAPGELGSFQRASKAYQFWTRADKTGTFAIDKVVAGDYFLYAWVPGIMGDYIYNTTITVKPGDAIKLPSLVFTPPRCGPTLWEIGVPDRSAAEFFIPDPSPTLVNPLFVNQDKFRQYGLWERYTELFPDKDLVYNVATSKFATDWWFAQVTRKTGEKTYTNTIWQVVFPLDKVTENSQYTLQIAFAAASEARLEVRVNRADAPKPVFTTPKIGEDNAIARHGIHGLYWLYTISIPCASLVVGDNTIFLNQVKGETTFSGIMYDYIRFEGPPA